MKIKMKIFFSFKLTDPREFPLMMKGRLQGWFSGQFNTVTNSQLSGLTAPLSHNKAAAALTHLLTSPPATGIREYPGLVALLRKAQIPRSPCNRLPLASCWLMPEPIIWQGHGTTVRAQTSPEEIQIGFCWQGKKRIVAGETTSRICNTH